jgi:uncharacterized protein YeeX (DUF496 family)
MVSIAEIFSNPLITFILGLTPSIITIVFYYQGKVSSREKVIQPHILKLYDIAAKILEEKNAVNLFFNYQKMQKAKADYDNIRQIPTVLEEQRKTYDDTFGEYILTSFSFNWSLNSAEKLVQLCIELDLEYQKMDTDGLLSLLKKRHKEAFTKLKVFDQTAKGMIFITERIRKEKLKTEIQPEGQEHVRDVQLTEHLSILFQTLSITKNLISCAPEVEKQLSKFL